MTENLDRRFAWWCAIASASPSIIRAHRGPLDEKEAD